MAQGIAINGINLHEVRLPAEPYNERSVVYLGYPKSQIRFSYSEDKLSLVVPAYLAVEIYRTGILPQEIAIAVGVKIGGRSAGWFVVSDVRYPTQNDGPFGRVTFTLSRVPRPAAHNAEREPPTSRRLGGNGTYVTDITHFLDENGELAQIPATARKLARFLTLLIEAATAAFPADDHDSHIRCRRTRCTGSIRISLVSPEDEISWYCPVCEHNGVIHNWRETKWNQLTRNERPE